MGSLAPSLVASATAGFVLFGVFVVAFVVLAVITLRWAVRRDRAGRAQWVQRRAEEEQAAAKKKAAPPVGPRRGGQRSGR